MKYKFRINGKLGAPDESAKRLHGGIIPGTMNRMANCENPPFELRCVAPTAEQRDISAQRSPGTGSPSLRKSLCESLSSARKTFTLEPLNRHAREPINRESPAFLTPAFANSDSSVKNTELSFDSILPLRYAAFRLTLPSSIIFLARQDCALTFTSKAQRRVL